MYCNKFYLLYFKFLSLARKASINSHTYRFPLWLPQISLKAIFIYGNKCSVPCIKHKRLSNFFLHINSRFRSHNIDWCPLHSRHHRPASHPAGGRVFLVATQTITTRVCRADWWERDKQWKLEVPTTPGESAARTAALGTTETTTAATTSWPTEQHQSKTQWIPQPQDTINRVSSFACACKYSHTISVSKKKNLT